MELLVKSLVVVALCTAGLVVDIMAQRVADRERSASALGEATETGEFARTRHHRDPRQRRHLRRQRMGTHRAAVHCDRHLTRR